MIASLLISAGLTLQAASPEVVRHVQAALAAKQAGQMPTAIAEFKTVTELAPDLPAGFVNLGAAYIENHDYASAVAPLKHALEMKPDLAGAKQMLGFALLAQGYASEAIPYLEQAQATDMLGIAQLKVGHFAEAVADLNAALTKHPNDPDLLYYLGRASGLLAKEAMDTLESAYPESARAKQALGENYAALKQMPQAETEYREALRSRPDTPGIHLALGQLFVATADWPKAEEEFRAEQKLQPGDAETAYALGNALLQQGNVKAARTELERADKLRPHMPETLYALGKAESLDGDAANAEKTWLAMLGVEDIGPIAAQAHFGLATLYRKQGRTSDAAHQMEAFKKAQPK